MLLHFADSFARKGGRCVAGVGVVWLSVTVTIRYPEVITQALRCIL